MKKKTIVVDEKGNQLATFPDALTQVKVGQDFHISQPTLTVVSVHTVQGTVLITVKEKT